MLDFKTIRRAIIDNVDDDKQAREILLKISDMQTVSEMRSFVIKSVTDLDDLEPILVDMQLAELLVEGGK